MSAFLLLIILIPAIEIYLFIKIGSQIGAFNTISLIFITAIIGFYYAKYEGLNTLRSAFSQIVKNELPIYEIISGAALINALEIANKKIGEILMVICGAGAAAISCAKMYKSLGVKKKNMHQI